MASLSRRAHDSWALQFLQGQQRRTICLGAMSEPQAAAVKERVEALVDALRADSPPDKSTAAWVHDLPDGLHSKLVKAGLVMPRTDSDEAPAVPLLGAFCDSYIARRTDVKGATAIFYRHTRRCLVEYFGATRPMDRITPGDAEDWRRWLTDDQHLADNTIRRRCALAKQFFRAAVRKRLIVESPFGDMAGCGIRANRARDYFITREEAAKVLEACPDAQWRLLFALSRFGGLRCPSEHLGLRWQHVDWERGRMTIHSPKTEHHEGKGSRVIPIFPELRPYLEEVWEQAEPGTVWAISRCRDTNANLRTRLTKIIRLAGLAPWPKLFQNLRATRETELAETFPIHVVCAWIGNSQAVARKHYLQVTEEHFQRAVANDDPNEKALQLALQKSGVDPCKAAQADFHPQAGTPDTSPVCINSHQFTSYCKPVQVGDSRLERLPSTL